MGLLEGKRQQIVDAAVEEFRELGFVGGSMDRIAARANVSKRTVYNHFESKEALFRAILDGLLEQVALALDVSFDPERDIRTQLVELGWAEGRLLTAQSFMSLASMVMSETIRDQALTEEFRCRTEHIDAFRRFIAEAAAAGAIKVENPQLAADQFLGLLKSQAFWPALMSGEIVSREAMNDVIEETVEMFMARYGSAES